MKTKRIRAAYLACIFDLFVWTFQANALLFECLVDGHMIHDVDLVRSKRGHLFFDMGWACLYLKQAHFIDTTSIYL